MINAKWSVLRKEHFPRFVFLIKDLTKRCAMFLEYDPSFNGRDSTSGPHAREDYILQAG